jgi:AraC family transcriptional regulator
LTGRAKETHKRRERVEPKIIERPAFTVAGMVHSGNNENNEIPTMWEAMGPRLSEVQHVVNPEVCYGVVDNMDEGSGTFDYMAGIEIERVTELPEGMVRWDVPAGTYAVFTCTLPGLGEAYAHAYATWLPQSGYERAPVPEFELYGGDFDPRDPSSEMEIYIPIR